MNYEEIISNLTQFKDAYYKCIYTPGLSDEERRILKEQVTIQYGELEEVILRFSGIRKVEYESRRGPKIYFSSYVEAGLSPGTGMHNEGYQQILKVIGKVQQLAKDPTLPKQEHSISTVVQVLRRFRECCQYIKDPPKNEKAVQDIMWIMLRTQFDRVEREETLPKFGVKNYRPDFGIPDLQLLVEAKFIGEKTQIAAIQEEILADIPGYLKNSQPYNAIVLLVYDDAQKLRDPRKFVEDIRSVDGIVDVIIIPGIS